MPLPPPAVPLFRCREGLQLPLRSPEHTVSRAPETNRPRTKSMPIQDEPSEFAPDFRLGAPYRLHETSDENRGIVSAGKPRLRIVHLRSRTVRPASPRPEETPSSEPCATAPELAQTAAPWQA